MGIPLTLNNLLIVICVVFVLKAVFLLTIRYLSANLSSQFIKEITKEFFQKLGKVKISHLDTLARGETTAILSEQLRKSSTIIIWMITIVSSSFAMIGYLVLAFLVSVELTVIALLSSSVFILAMKFIMSRSGAIGKEYVESSKVFNVKILEVLEHLGFSKTISKEDKVLDRTNRPIERVTDNWTWYQFFSSSLSLAFQPLVAVVLSIIIFFAVKLDIPFGELLVFLVAIQRILPTFTAIQNLGNNIILAKPGLDSVWGLIDGLDKNKERESSQMISFENKISFSGVGFSYGGNKVFESVNVEFEKGKIHALVGQSGSGKSTLLSLMQGFCDPDEGDVRVDGKSLKDADLRNWRERFAFVPQEDFLLGESIKENICYLSDYQKEKFDKAVDRAHVEEFLSSLEGGSEYILTDQTTNLSGGQKQRISLARMFYLDREIVILDEPTSALDKEFESKIMDEVVKLKHEGKTVVLITHNPGLISHADHVLKIENKNVYVE